MTNIIYISLFYDLSFLSGRLYSIYKYTKDKTQVKIITSNFDHSSKKYKEYANNDIITTYIPVPSYKNNIGLKRLYSHIIFAHKLKKALVSIKEKPDYIYCAMPTSTAAFVCGSFCKKNKIKFIIDVIDIWPDSLIPTNAIWKIFKVLLLPWKYITISGYKYANIILGESEKYTEIAYKYNKNAIYKTLYIGIDKNFVNSLINESKLIIEKNNNEIWICYAGSLGNSYDFETLIKSVSSLNNKYKYKLLFIGDGVKRDEIEKKILYYKVNAHITGYLKYGDLLKYLSYCDIAINIFKEHTKVVHSYKFNDYVATNCFILNSLSGETAKMISDYKIGLNFDYRKNTLEETLLEVVKHWDIYNKWKNNNNLLIKEVLDKNIIYSKLYDIL